MPATNATAHTYAYYAQLFRAPLAVLRLLEHLRRVDAGSPLFLLSDAGLDFSGMAKLFNAWFAHAGKSQKTDHGLRSSKLSAAVTHVHAKAPWSNFGNELVYLRRVGSVMALCACEFVVILEEDTCVHHAPRVPPSGDVGGVIHGWCDYAHIAGFEGFLRLRGVRAPPPYGRVWGCSGGCYYRVSALSNLSELRAGTASSLWRQIKAAAPDSINAVDMAVPSLVHALGGRVVPWAETSERFRSHQAGFSARKQSAVRLPAHSTTAAFEHKCDTQLAARRAGEAGARLPAAQAWLAREVSPERLRQLPPDGEWAPPSLVAASLLQL